MEYIDCTPTWAGLMPVLMILVVSGETDESKEIAKSEITKAAKAADHYNEMCGGPKNVNSWVSMVPGLFTDLESDDFDTLTEAKNDFMMIGRSADKFNEAVAEKV